jgi:hypothetical protein
VEGSEFATGPVKVLPAQRRTAHSPQSNR